MISTESFLSMIWNFAPSSGMRAAITISISMTLACHLHAANEPDSRSGTPDVVSTSQPFADASATDSGLDDAATEGNLFETADGPLSTPSPSPSLRTTYYAPSRPSWFRAEYLGCWLRGYESPALVSTSPLGTAPTVAGVMGQPSTTVMDSQFGDGLRSGMRFEWGTWWDDTQQFGTSGSFFTLLDPDNQQTYVGDGTSIIARPFTNVAPAVNGPDAQLVALPGLSQGQVVVDPHSRLISGDLLLRRPLDPCAHRCDPFRCDVVGGYRYFEFSENLDIFETLESTAVSGVVPVGTRFDLWDKFSTKNTFHGGVVGLAMERRVDRWFGGITTKIALGSLRRVVEIRGTTTVTVPGVGSDTRVGGLLAQPSNIGRYADNEFAALPELTLRGGYWLTNSVQLSAGYTLMLLNDVRRAGGQIDSRIDARALDPNFAGPATRPQFSATSDLLWLQAFTCGLTYHY